MADDTDHHTPIQRTRPEARRVPGASSPSHDLPWHLLTDVTMEEMLIYYPNHVFNWPGLSLLFSHYTHRNVGNWEYAQVARRVAIAYDIEPKGLSAKFRQWLKFSGSELIKNYDPDEEDHFKGIYSAIEGRYTSMSGFLQAKMQQPPGDLARLLPARPIHKIGATIRQHPRGFFAARVRAAVKAGTDTGVVIPPIYTSDFHPLIDRLADMTMSLSDRQNEVTYNYNESTSPDRYVRPAQRFVGTTYKRRDDDPQGQIWEWVNPNTTLIEHLEQNFTREDILRECWGDLRGDVFLWLDMGLAPGQIIEMLPQAALALHHALDKEGADKFKATLRKVKQAAFEARVKRVKGSTWDNGKKERLNAPSHEDNGVLWKSEKRKFDEWAKQYKIRLQGKNRRVQVGGGKAISNKRGRSDAGYSSTTGIVFARASSFAFDFQLSHQPGQIMAPYFYADAFIASTSNSQIGRYAFPLEELDSFRDAQYLYNFGKSAKQPVAVPRLGHYGQGKVPRWWRDQRQNLLRYHAIPFLPVFIDNYFDAGHDILPTADYTGWESYPGDFVSLSDVPASSACPEGMPHQAYRTRAISNTWNQFGYLPYDADQSNMIAISFDPSASPTSCTEVDSDQMDIDSPRALYNPDLSKAMTISLPTLDPAEDSKDHVGTVEIASYSSNQRPRLSSDEADSVNAMFDEIIQGYDEL